MVLRKRFPRSTLVLGIWCGKRPRKNYKHVEDRTLSDVTEEKTFN